MQHKNKHSFDEVAYERIAPPQCTPRCKKNCQNNFTQEQIEFCYKSFRSCKTDMQKNVWFAYYCKKLPKGPKRIRNPKAKHRRSKIGYTLPLETSAVEVCFKFFSEVLDIHIKTGTRISNVLDRCKNGFMAHSKRGQHQRPEIKKCTEQVIKHILSFNPEPMCKFVDGKCTGELFLSSDLSCQKMYESYASINSKYWVCQTKYYNIVKSTMKIQFVDNL